MGKCLPADLSPMCDPSSRKEISAAPMTPVPVHAGAHSPGSARPVKNPLVVLRPRHQSHTLLVSLSVQARRQEFESHAKYLNHLRGKYTLQLEGDCTSLSLQQAVHCLFRPTISSTLDAHEGPHEPSQGSTTVWTPHTGRSTEVGSHQTQGRLALPPPRGLTGSPCSTSAIWMSTAWPSCRSSSTSQLPELTFQQFGRTPS